MQSIDHSSELTSLHNQLQIASAAFDAAVKKDVPLGELKVIFREMKILKTRVDELEQTKKTQTQSS